MSQSHSELINSTACLLIRSPLFLCQSYFMVKQNKHLLNSVATKETLTDRVAGILPQVTKETDLKTCCFLDVNIQCFCFCLPLGLFKQRPEDKHLSIFADMSVQSVKRSRQHWTDIGKWSRNWAEKRSAARQWAKIFQTPLGAWGNVKEHLFETEAHNLLHLSSIKICHFRLQTVRCVGLVCQMTPLYTVMEVLFWFQKQPKPAPVLLAL